MKRFTRSLAIFAILGLILSATAHYTAAPAHAQQNTKCLCHALNPATDKELGKWVSYKNDELGKSIEDPEGTACKAAGIQENAQCNALTQSVISAGFRVPTFGELIGNLIRLFFLAAGIIALFFLLRGAFIWVSSGGSEDKIGEAQKMIASAVLGLVVLVAVLTLVILLEQVVFGGRICLGVSCTLDLSTVRIISQ